MSVAHSYPPAMASATTDDAHARSVFKTSLTDPPLDAVLRGPIDQNREMFERFEVKLGRFLAAHEFDFDQGMIDRIQDDLVVLKGRVATALIEGYRRTAPRSVNQRVTTTV